MVPLHNWNAAAGKHSASSAVCEIEPDRVYITIWLAQFLNHYLNINL
jgi:hypothetical protein